MFGFKTDPCMIVAPDGSIRSTLRARFDSAMIFIQGADVVVFPGDEIRRTLPNGTEEAFNVVDPAFYDGGPLGPHFQIKVVRKGIFQPHTGGNYNLHVAGPNAKINISSHDHSMNISNTGDVFGDIVDALKSGVQDQQKLAELIQAVEAMKSEKGKSGFIQAYQKFIGLAADHIGVITPFLPALTSLMS